MASLLKRGEKRFVLIAGSAASFETPVIVVFNDGAVIKRLTVKRLFPVG
ncbi:MAG: hypothetical protein IPJ30_19170 [Acidobacteria bacterium]|nr:hypothetical protein [Acidobacteriota bacterium]